MPAVPTAAYMGGLREFKGGDGGLGHAANCVSMGVNGHSTMGSVQREESFKEIEVGADFRNPFGDVHRSVLGESSVGHAETSERVWFGGQRQRERHQDVMRTGKVNRNFARRVENTQFHDAGDIEMSRLGRL
jgi:hypothetical protein